MTPYYEQGWVTIYHADCADVLPSVEAADLLPLILERMS